MADFILLIGVVGLLLILVAFGFNLFHLTNAKSPYYFLLNLSGSTFLAYYALALKSMPFLVLQIIWALFSLYKLIILLIKK